MAYASLDGFVLFFRPDRIASSMMTYLQQRNKLNCVYIEFWALGHRRLPGEIASRPVNLYTLSEDVLCLCAFEFCPFCFVLFAARRLLIHLFAHWSEFLYFASLQAQIAISSFAYCIQFVHWYSHVAVEQALIAQLNAPHPARGERSVQYQGEPNVAGDFRGRKAWAFCARPSWVVPALVLNQREFRYFSIWFCFASRCLFPNEIFWYPTNSEAAYIDSIASLERVVEEKWICRRARIGHRRSKTFSIVGIDFVWTIWTHSLGMSGQRASREGTHLLMKPLTDLCCGNSEVVGTSTYDLNWTIDFDFPTVCR